MSTAQKVKRLCNIFQIDFSEGVRRSDIKKMHKMYEKNKKEYSIETQALLKEVHDLYKLQEEFFNSSTTTQHKRATALKVVASNPNRLPKKSTANLKVVR